MEDELFPDFQAVEDHLNDDAEEIMEINHQTVQSVRRRVVALLQFKDRWNEILDDMITTELIGMKMLSDLAGDMLMDEFGMEQADSDEIHDENDDGDQS